MEKLIIKDIIGTQNAILHKFGLQVFNSASQFISKDSPIILSFNGLKNITSAFCNASIGKLYLDFPKTKELLYIEGVEENSIWQDKINDAINLATNPDLLKINESCIDELFS